MTLQPTTVEALQSIVRENKHLTLDGGGTKPTLSTAPDGVISLDMRGFNGIIEYEPGEYTICPTSFQRDDFGNLKLKSVKLLSLGGSSATQAARKVG